jgi:hypothetical protein
MRTPGLYETAANCPQSRVPSRPQIMTKLDGVGLGTRKAEEFIFCPHIQAPQIGDDGVLVSVRSPTMLELQAPLPVAQLPRPLDAEGKTHFNSVYGVSTLKKVKRHEIVAAVDGEAISICDVSFDHLVLNQVP